MDGPRAVSSAQDIDWKNDVSFIVASTGIFFLNLAPTQKGLIHDFLRDILTQLLTYGGFV